MLIGVDDKTLKIHSVRTKIDPVMIGNVVEGALGYNIKFELRYFTIDDDTSSVVGLLYVHPSKKTLTSPRNLNCENNQLIVGENDIFTRRNTKSAKANREDLDTINKRIHAAPSRKISNEKYPAFKDGSQQVEFLWNVIKGKKTVNAESFAINIRGILQFSDHSKPDFAKLTGIPISRLEVLLKGEEMPDLSELIRISNLHGLDPLFFFQLTYHGRVPSWNMELVRYSIIKRIRNLVKLESVPNVEGFFGDVIYQFAKNIVALKNWTRNYHFNDIFINSGNGHGVSDAVDKYSDEQKDSLNREIRVQYYKVLEQANGLEDCHPFTEQEYLIVRWMSCQQSHLARIITESIDEILIGTNHRPVIEFHFWRELRQAEVKKRKYDSFSLNLIFS